MLNQTKQLQIYILFLICFIQGLFCQICPFEDFGQIDGYSCLQKIQSHIIIKSSPSLANENIIYTSNKSKLTQMNLLTSQTIQTIDTNNQADIIYMTKQDSTNRSILVIADSNGYIIEIDVELNAEIQRYQLDTKLYTFDSTINIDYETQTIITYQSSNVFFVNYNTKSVFKPTLVGEKYIGSLIIDGLSSVLLNMYSKAYICDIIKSNCKSLSLPNITIINFFSQKGDFFAVVAYGSQGYSITLFTLNRIQKTTSRTSFMIIPVGINNMVLDISNAAVQYAITVGVADCKIYNFNTKTIELSIDLKSNAIDIQDTLNTVLMADVKTALQTASFDDLYLSGNNLVISSAKFIILINYQVAQSTVISTKYIELVNNRFNNVFILPDNNILLVGDQTLVYLYNPLLQIYILNSCVTTFSLDSQVQSQFFQDDAQNTLLSLNSQGMSYQWNKLTGRALYYINTFAPGALFKVSIALNKIVYYNYGTNYSIYDNVTKLKLLDGIVAAQDVVFDETNMYIFLKTTLNIIAYPLDPVTLVLKAAITQSDTTNVNQIFSIPATSQVLIVRQANAVFCTVSNTGFTVLATVVDNFISQYYDSTLNYLIAYTQTSTNYYIKSYAFPSKTMVQYDNDPTLAYSLLQSNPVSLMMSMYISSQNKIIGWTYTNIAPTTTQQFTLKGLIYKVQFYFMDTISTKNYVIVVTVNGFIWVFDSSTQDIKSSYIVHNGLVPKYYYADYINKMIVTYAEDYRLVKYDYANGKLIKQWQLRSTPIGFSLDLNTNMIFIGDQNKIYSLSYQSNDMLKEIVGFQSSTVSGVFSETLGQLISTNNLLVRVYDMYSFSQIIEFPQVHTGAIVTMRYADSLKLIILCSADKTCSTWNSVTQSNSQIFQLNQPNTVNPDAPINCDTPQGTVLSGNILYVYCSTGLAVQWNYNTVSKNFEYTNFFNCSTSAIQTIRVYEEQNYLLSLDVNAKGGVYFLTNQTLAFQVQGDKASVDRTNQVFITYGRDGIVLYYNMQGSIVFNQTIHIGYINQLFSDTTGKKLITIGQSYTHTAPLKTGIYDEKSNSIIIADNQGAILFLNYPLIGLKQILYSAHSSSVVNISLSRLTNTLVTFGSDNAIRMWNFYAYVKTDFRQLIFSDGSIQDGFMDNEKAVTVQQNGMVKQWDFTLKYQKYMQKLKTDTQDFRFKIINLPTLNKILINSIAQIFMLNSQTYQILKQVRNICNGSKVITSATILFMIFCINNNQINVFGESLTLLPSQPTHTLTTIFIFTDIQVNEALMELSAYTSRSNILIWKFTQQGVFTSPPLQINITPSSQVMAMFYIQISSQLYNIVTATLLGTIQVYNYDTVTTPVLSLELDATNNGKQLIFFQKQDNRIFFKRFGSSQILIYKTDDWSKLGFLITPCIGYQNRFDYDVTYDLICVSCFGQYNVFSYGSMQMIGNVRILAEFNQYGDQDNANVDDLRIVSDSYIIHCRLKYIFIFQVNRNSNTIEYKGKIQQVKSFVKVLRFSLNKQPTYTSGEYVFIGTKISKLMFIIEGSTACTQTMNIRQVKQTFLSVIDISSRMNTFFKMTNFQFRISLDNNQALPEIPQFPYASQSELYINYDSNQIMTTNSFQKFYPSVSGFVSVNLKNLILKFDKQVGQTGTQELSFQNIQNISIINCTLQSLNEIIILFQQISNIVLDTLTVDTQTIDGGKNTDPNNLNYYLFYISDITTLQVTNMKIINSSFVSTALMYITNFSMIQKQQSEVAKKGIVTIDGLTIQSNRIDFSNASAFINLLYMSLVKINNLNIIGNVNKAASIPLMIPQLFEFQICNQKSMTNITFNQNTDFLFLIDQSYIGSSLANTNTTQVATSVIDDSLTINNITIEQNQLTALSSLSTLKSYFIQLNSDQISINTININQNTCAPPCIVSAVININASKNGQVNTLSAFNNVGFDQAVILLTNSTIIGNSWNSGQNNCSSSGTLKIQSTKATITGGEFSQNICLVENCGGAISISQTSTVIINGVNFTENNSASYGGAIFQMQKSSLTINTATFDKNTAIAEGGGIFSYECSLNLNQVRFTENRSKLNGGGIYVERGSFSMNDSFMYKNFAQNSGGALYSLDVTNVSVNLLQGYQNTATSQGGAVFIQNGKLTFSNSKLEYNSCSEGGSLYIKNSLTGSAITSSFFTGNYVIGSGGAIMMIKSDCNVENCVFKDNVAGAGGAIRYTQIKPSFMIPMNISPVKDSCNSYKNNSCSGNSAVAFGSNICSNPSQINIIPGSSQLEAFQISADPPIFQINNIRSGVESINIQYQLLDEFGETLKFEKKNIPTSVSSLQNDPSVLLRNLNSEVHQISEALFLEIDAYKTWIINEQPSNVVEQNLLIQRDYITRYENSQFMIEGIGIIGIPKQNAKFKLSFEGINTFLSNNTQALFQSVEIIISFRECIQGEAFTKYCENCKLSSCKICQLGSYILDPPSSYTPQNCTICNKPFAESCQQSSIKLLPGYWRSNNMTDLVAECNQQFGLCTGDEEHGYCKEGYTGTLCETCDQKGEVWGQKYSYYGVIEMKDCLKCTTIFTYLPYFIIYFLFICCIIAFITNDANSKIINHIQAKMLSKSRIIHFGITSFSGKSLMIGKICLFYFQILTALMKFDIIFENSLKIAKFVPVYLFSPIITMEYWLDCGLANIDLDVGIQYMRLIWSVLVYIILLLGSLVVYLIYSSIVYRYYKYEEKRYVKTKYLSYNFFIFAILFYFYAMQHSILQNYMKILSCQTVGDKQYIVGQLNQECDSYEHSMWRILYIIPVFAVVGYVIPLYIAHYLYQNRKILYNPLKISLIRQFGFFYFEYKPQYWFWEFLKLQYRTLIIIFLNVYNDDIKKKGCFVLITLMIYSLLAQKTQPYSLPQMNKLDKRSNNVTAFLIWLTVLSSHNSDQDQVDFSLTIMSITMILFIIYFIYQFIWDFYTRYEDIIIKSRPAQFILYYAGYFLSKELFQAKNKLLLRKAPFLYRIIHCQNQISFDHINRWRFLRSYIFDFARRRRRDQFAQFYLYQIQTQKENTNSTTSSQSQKVNNQTMSINNTNLTKKNGSLKEMNQSIRDLLQSNKLDEITNKRNSEKQDINVSKKNGKLYQNSSTGDSLSKKQSLKQTTTLRDVQQDIQQVESANQEIFEDDDDEREEIIKKIYPVKRPIMAIYNQYSGMKIDNYKEAQINDICNNPFFYHDYTMNYKLDTPQDKLTAMGEQHIKDLRFKVCLNKPEDSTPRKQFSNTLISQTPRLEYPAGGQYLSQKEIGIEYDNSMQDLSDIMSEDYNTRQVQEFRKKPIKESELISLSQDRNIDNIYSPNSLSYDYGLSDIRLQSPKNEDFQQNN